MQANYKGALYLSTAASIWGGMYVASKYALETVPPFTLLFIRYLIASVILVLWCRYSKVSIIPREHKWLMFQIGFFGYFLSVGMQFVGTRLSSAHLGAAITTLSPVFQSIFAVFLLKKTASRRQLASITLSFIGILIVTDAINTLRTDTFNVGNLFFLTAAALWGYYSVLSKKVADAHPVLRITTWGILLATVFAAFPAMLELGSWDTAVLADRLVMVSILYLAVVSTVVAYYCWNKGLALLNPHQAGLFMFLQSIVGSILGYLLLGESLSSAFLVGTVLILIAVYVSIRSTE
ncbi:DMT family transporter [Sporomusa malonica]|uniref:Threonine/homoserine efflux transporter RhtA n=1 Tax=Sporomusa malonica TaxID=112901 RepID=A0A1W2DF80_9FIRM|nr:DMT family transporter [Sporomusa malonica]SMC96115.1 Threonine/homoserine efflux transporter RhtA [Sporomusa malonica]